MAGSNTNNIIKASLPRGQRDVYGFELQKIKNIVSKITKVYESYGFEELSTPAFEFSDALGKFLPDSERPNAGVFSFQDDDEKWLSLRYDLTAPLARFVSENYDNITKPYKRYQFGSVWRNEKPGPGRYREFLQLDADIIGSDNYIVDAELLMLATDSMRSLGLSEQNFNIKVSNRKLLDAIIELIRIDDDIDENRRLTILRAIDKLDRVGLGGVEKLLSDGRKDESGDYTKGAQLSKRSIEKILNFISIGSTVRNDFINQTKEIISKTEQGPIAIDELIGIDKLLTELGYNQEILFDGTIVRGLEYYTGTIFETNIVLDEKKREEMPIIGSVGGGGRYDKLISRFRKDQVAASGFSIGVSRLVTVMQMANLDIFEDNYGPVLILNMDKEYQQSYYQIATEIREKGISAEVYLGSSGMKAQMKYADRRNSPFVIIEGTNERERGIVTVKNLIKGKEISNMIENRDQWINNDEIQFEINRDQVANKISEIFSKINKKT